MSKHTKIPITGDFFSLLRILGKFRTINWNNIMEILRQNDFIMI